jgi:hypothetical protein
VARSATAIGFSELPTPATRLLPRCASATTPTTEERWRSSLGLGCRWDRRTVGNVWDNWNFSKTSYYHCGFATVVAAAPTSNTVASSDFVKATPTLNRQTVTAEAKGTATASAPTATARPTATVAPTVTTGPTATPRPTVTTQPTLTADELIQAQVKPLYKDLIKAEVRDLGNGKILAIDYNASDNLTKKLIIEGIMLDFKNNASKLFNQMPDIAGLDVKAYFGFTDVKGNSTSEVAVRLGISRDNSAKVNWSQIQLKNMDKIVDSFYLHPAVKSIWADIQK